MRWVSNKGEIFELSNEEVAILADSAARDDVLNETYWSLPVIMIQNI